MKEHELKTWPDQFQASKTGDKTFEARRDDRDFEVGDVLLLREWDPGKIGAGVEADEGYMGPPGQGYTGDVLRMKIKYILRGPIFCLPKGLAIMSVVPETDS